MDIKEHLDFRNKTLREIRWWAWAASIMPVSCLAALFFIWAYGTDRVYNIAMITGSSLMMVIAVLWWWWALHAIKTLVNHWDETRDNVKEVVVEVKGLRALVRDVFQKQRDK